MDGQEISSGRADSEWSMHGGDEIINVAFLVIIFITIRLIGGDFPGRSVGADVKLGEFLSDSEALKLGLGRYFVAKSDSVIKNSETHSKDARVFGRFG